jgi:hypothetical protein
VSGRRALVGVGVFFGLFACYQAWTGNGAGTEGGRQGWVRNLITGEDHCVTTFPEGPGIVPSSCIEPGAGAPRALEASAPTPAVNVCGADSTGAILATIRTLESGDYRKGSNAGGAMGAYQFIQSTWDAVARRAGRPDLVGVPPYKASPADQDALAALHVTEAMGGTGDVSRIPLVWYVGNASPAMDVVPHPEVGNRLTPRQYQAKWMSTYRAAGAPCAVSA